MAIDRRRIIDRVLSGIGTPAVGFYTPSVAWAYNPDARVPARNPIAAKRLIAEVMAGTPELRRRPAITLAFPGQVGATPTAVGAEIIQQLQEVGLHVRPLAISFNGYLEQLQAGRDFDVVILTGAQGPDPDTLSARFGSTGSMQVMGYANPDLDAALADGGRQAEPSARARAYFRAQQILAADLPIAPLYETVRVTVVRDGIRGLPHEDARGLVGDYTFNLVRLRGRSTSQAGRR
jgi:ABC-type transport system substrate-binding protein